MQTSPKRLETLMTARRLELGMRTWKALADRAGVSYETVRALKAGGVIREDSVYAIERALCWRSGSIRRILDGGEPIPSVATARAELGTIEARAEAGQLTPREIRQQRIARARAEVLGALETDSDEEAVDDIEDLVDEIRRLARIARRRLRGDDERRPAV